MNTAHIQPEALLTDQIRELRVRSRSSQQGANPVLALYLLVHCVNFRLQVDVSREFVRHSSLLGSVWLAARAGSLPV